MRKLASIEKILKILPIKDADRIELATVLGWNVVVKKGEFKIGDMCVYVEIDSILPDKPEFEFMRIRKFKVKTIKLKGQISQGIVFPLSILPDNIKISEGMDVTDILGITKYEDYDPEPAKKHGKIYNYFMKFKIIRILFLKRKKKGGFPEFIIKTDETRIQAMPKVIDNDITFVVTEKVDGSSLSCFYNKKEFGVCSRNTWIKKNDNSRFWKAVKKYNLEYKVKEISKLIKANVVIQGEVVGQGVQSNKYKISGFDLYIFNIFDIDNRKYLKHSKIVEICKQFDLKMVPFIGNIKFNTVEEYVKYSMGKSVINKDIQREGIVCRDPENEEVGRVSFKVINPEFLLKFDEK